MYTYYYMVSEVYHPQPELRSTTSQLEATINKGPVQHKAEPNAGTSS